MNIHPTAIISPEAILGENIKIGPYVIIDAGVKIGAHCTIQAYAVLTGGTSLGDENLVGYGSILGAEPQDVSFKPGMVSEVRIGNRNKIREYVTIHRSANEGGVTRLGNDNFIMNGVHMGHDVSVGNCTVIANNTLLGGYVEVQNGAVLGGATIFHQHIRVGRNVMVRGGGRFTKDIPPYTIANYTNTLTGLNAIGLKRMGLTLETRLEIKRAFKLLYRSGLNVGQALEAAQQQEWGSEAGCFFDFVRTATKRGICRCARGEDPNNISLEQNNSKNGDGKEE